MSEYSEREWLEGLRYEDKFPDCIVCDDSAWVIYGDEQLPCPQCRRLDYDAAINATSPRKRRSEEER